MNTHDAFAKIVTLLSPYLARGVVNVGNPMPKVKTILEDLWAAAHAEGFEEAQNTIADWHKPL